jgi:hypothetical protein
MRRLFRSRALLLTLVVLGASCLAIALTQPLAAAGRVEYTWTLAALGQGGWIGGPLFEDGSAGGGGAFSAGNGKLIARFEPTTWTENGSEQITICFDVSIIKGPSNAFPPTLCLGPADVTGTPVKMTLFGAEHIFRITEN